MPSMTTWLIIGGAAAVGGYVLYQRGTLHKIIPMVPSPDPANLPASAVGPNVPDRIASKRTVGQVIAETSFNMLPASAQQKALAAGTTVKRSQQAIDQFRSGDIAGGVLSGISAYQTGAKVFSPSAAAPPSSFGHIPKDLRTPAQQAAAEAAERASYGIRGF
jgi:hypothetical protein